MGSNGNIQQLDSLTKDFNKLVFEEKFIPRGSHEFREVLKLCENEHDENGKQEFRTRSNTIDSTYGRKSKGVHFASNMISSSQERHVRFAEEQVHGIHHHDQERRRSNTIDSSYKRNTKFRTTPGSSDVPTRKSSKSHQHGAEIIPETGKSTKDDMDVKVDYGGASQTSANKHVYHSALQKYKNRNHDDVAFGTTQKRDFIIQSDGGELHLT